MNSPDPGADPVGYNRAAVWKNAARDAFVAELTAGVAAGGAVALSALGGPDAKVAVLVENYEHPAALAALLPGWPVLHAGATDPDLPGASGGPAGRQDPGGFRSGPRRARPPTSSAATPPGHRRPRGPAVRPVTRSSVTCTIGSPTTAAYLWRCAK